jgi:hypothetical protein
MSACSRLGCPEGTISGRYLRLCPRDRAVKVDFRRPRRRLRCSASDIAKRCLTAGRRGALADSGDVNCCRMPLVGRRQGATDDACSVGRWWIPQVSRLMLRGVGHRRSGSSDLAGALSRALLDEAFPTRVRCSTPVAALLAWWCMTGRLCRRRVAGRAARRVAAALGDARRGRGAWLSPDSVAAAAYVVAVAQMPVSLEGARGVATDAAAVQVSPVVVGRLLLKILTVPSVDDPVASRLTSILVERWIYGRHFGYCRCIGRP